MIEMALVAVLLLVLTFGIADIGWYMYRSQQAHNCTREAARRAAVHKAPTTESYCVDSSLQPTVAIGATTVTATVDMTHNWFVIGYLVPGIGNTVSIHSETTMRLEAKGP